MYKKKFVELIILPISVYVHFTRTANWRGEYKQTTVGEGGTKVEWSG